jgi:hypothetical protein
MRDNGGSLLGVEASRIHRFFLRRAPKNPLKFERSKPCMEKTYKVSVGCEHPVLKIISGQILRWFSFGEIGTRNGT